MNIPNLLWFILAIGCTADLTKTALPLPRLLPQSKPWIQTQPLTVRELIQGMDNHDFSEIYFKNNAVIARANAKKLDTDENVVSNDASVYEYITPITPAITTKLVDISLKNQLNPIFLPDPLIVPSSGENPFFTMIYGYLFFSILRNLASGLFAAFQGQRSSRNGGSGPGAFSSPFGMDMGLSKRGNRDISNINVTFADWAGSAEVLEECSEVVTYFKNRDKYDQVGAVLPKGILLEGPPGTGKTLLAKAIACESNAQFIEMSGSEFIEMYVGLGAMRVRKLFDDARAIRPCVIFIDEIDAVGRQRSSSPVTNGNEEKDQTLNQLLAEMDGFKNNEGILVLAATNRRDILDKALLRPGRFDRIVNIPLPDVRSRQQIIDLYLTSKTVDPAVSTAELARLIPGYSGADIKNWINEASILLARNNETVLTYQVLDEAYEKTVVGIKKRVDDRSPEVKRRVAIHEMGHAFMVKHCRQYFDLKKVSMQATYSGAGGFTLFHEKEGMTDGLFTKDMLICRLMIALGGKAAETVFYGEDQVSTGATMDLSSANSLAVDMIERYGMGDQLNVFYRNAESSMVSKYSEVTRSMIDKEAAQLVILAYENTLRVIREHRREMEILVSQLLDKITMNVVDMAQFDHDYDYDDYECDVGCML